MGFEVVDGPDAGNPEPVGFTQEPGKTQHLPAGVQGPRDDVSTSVPPIAPDGFRPVKVHGVDAAAV